MSRTALVGMQPLLPHWIVVPYRPSSRTAVYIIIAICFWYYPEPSNQVAGLVCI